MTTTANKTWTDYTVGQILYGVFDRMENNNITVKSVGKKYVRFEGLRDDYVVERGDTRIVAQGYGGIGTVYESKKAHIEAVKGRKRRDAIVHYFSSDYGRNCRRLSDEKVQAIFEILEIPDEI